MKKPDPRILAIDLLSRSICHIRVAAVIFDDYGIFSWGWNSSGSDGYGQCAEIHAISRGNKKRMSGASIAIAGIRKKTIVSSRPCKNCMERLIKKKEY